MEESSLDFLDQLVPSAQNPEGDEAPSMRRSGAVPAATAHTTVGNGRSLAPPPPAVLAQVRERPGQDIDIVVDESAPYHEPPAASAADGSDADDSDDTRIDAVQMPWMTPNTRPPSSAPPRKIPLPGEAIPPARASDAPPGLEFTHAAPPSFEDPDAEDDDGSDDETIATETLVMPSGALGVVGALNSNAAAALGTPRKSDPAPAGAELFGELQGPARRSGGPPPAPSMRASAGPPPPPRPSARPPTPPSARPSDPYAARAAQYASAVAEPETVPLMAAVSEPPLPGSTLPSKPVVVSPRVWSVDSIPPDPPAYAGSAPGLSPQVAASLPPPAPPPGAGPSVAAGQVTGAQVTAGQVNSSYAGSAYVSSPPAGVVPSALTTAQSVSVPPAASAVSSPVSATSRGEASRPDASEWDEAPTNIYTREVHGRESGSGFHTYGSVAPLPAPQLPSVPPMATSPSGAPLTSVSVPRASLPMPSLPPMPTVPSMRAPQRAALWQARVQENIRWVAIGGVALFALLLWLVIPSGGGQGELVVNVSGPAGIAVDGVKVYIDEQLTCEESPCQLKKLEAKGHVVTIEAPGYMRTAPTAVLVKDDATTMHNVELVPAKGSLGTLNAATAPESGSGGTGFTISDSPGDLSVSLDGKSIGKPPLKLDALSPGEHVLRVAGGDRLEALERTLNLRDGEMQNLGALKLRVLRGRLKLVAGMNATGAQTTLDGRLIKLPHEAELDATVTHRLVMTREGHVPLKFDVTFEPGAPEREVVLDLVPEGAEAIQAPAGEVVTEEPARDEPRTTSAIGRGKASSGSAGKTNSGSGAKAGKGNGTLTFVSTPSSVVILDGRPIGKTPKNASVAPGDHTVVFVHATKGRKRAAAKVTAGGSKTISVKF